METEKGVGPALEKKEGADGKEMPGYGVGGTDEADHVRDSLRRAEPEAGVGGGESRPSITRESPAPSAEKLREEAADKAADEFRNAATLNKTAEPSRKLAPSTPAKAPPAAPAPAFPQVELTYECGNVETGLADVRGAVAAVSGDVTEMAAEMEEANKERGAESAVKAAKAAKRDGAEAKTAEKGKDHGTQPAGNVIVASVPIDKLGDLLDRLDLSGKRAPQKQAVEKPAERPGFSGQQAQPSPDLGQQRQASQGQQGQQGEQLQDRRKSDVITVRIIIKVKTQE